jgi:hypothetical protein
MKKLSTFSPQSRGWLNHPDAFAQRVEYKRKIAVIKPSTGPITTGSFSLYT